MRITPLPGVQVTFPFPDVPAGKIEIIYVPPHVAKAMIGDRLVEGKVTATIGWAQLEMSLEEASDFGTLLCGLTKEDLPDRESPYTPGGGASE